jgi:membrane protein
MLLMLTIDQAFNRIWQVKRKRPLMARLGLYWVALSFGPILFATSIAVASNMLGAWLGWADEPTWVRIALLRSVPFVLLCGLFALLYYGIPGRAVNPRHALIGGLTAGLVFTLMQRIFGLYITLFPSYTLIYGAFATIPIFLLWLYLLWLVILAGAVLVAVLPEARIAPLPNFPGQEAWIVMNLLQRLSLAQQQGELLSLGQLATDCRLAEGKCEILLERLADLNWATRTEDLHWVLARRLNGLYIDDIVEQFALSSSSIAALAEPTPWVEALQHSINPAPGSGQASLEALFILEKGAPIRQTATTIRGT